MYIIHHTVDNETVTSTAYRIHRDNGCIFFYNKDENGIETESIIQFENIVNIETEY